MKISKNELKQRIDLARELYSSCELCPHRCGVNRCQGELGICGQTADLKIAAAVKHKGEEPPLSGQGGVGSVFLSGCSMNCVYCQNFQASQDNIGEVIAPAELAESMLSLERDGAEAIGWVTPAHFVPGLLESHLLASDRGLRLPLIYNTGSFENVETLKLLEGVVDIYLADMRYADSGIAKKYSGVDNYAEISQRAVEEMYRQVGAFRESEKHGLIVRLLMIPDNMAGLWEMLCFLALELSPGIPISLMGQYQPVNQTGEFPELNRTITQQEYNEALAMAEDLGFETIYIQEISPDKHDLPDFNNNSHPFPNWSENDF